MIPIEETKRIDWNAIRAEYIGGATIRALADKYHVSKSAIGDRCSAERWTDSRTKAADKARMRAVQKTAEAAASNAVIRERIRQKLLIRLEREIDALPELIGTEMRQDITNMTYSGKNGSGKMTKRTEGGKTYKLRDLTAAFKDLTDGDDAKADDGMAAAGRDMIGYDSLFSRPVPVRTLDDVEDEP